MSKRVANNLVHGLHVTPFTTCMKTWICSCSGNGSIKALLTRRWLWLSCKKRDCKCLAFQDKGMMWKFKMWSRNIACERKLSRKCKPPPVNVADVTVSNPLLRDDSCNWAAKSQIVKLLAFQETRNVTKFQNVNKNCAKPFTNIMHIISYLHTCARSHSRCSNVKTLLGRLGGRGTQTGDLLRIWLFLVLFHRPVLL